MRKPFCGNPECLSDLHTDECISKVVDTHTERHNKRIARMAEILREEVGKVATETAQAVAAAISSGELWASGPLQDHVISGDGTGGSTELAESDTNQRGRKICGGGDFGSASSQPALATGGNACCVGGGNGFGWFSGGAGAGASRPSFDKTFRDLVDSCDLSTKDGRDLFQHLHGHANEIAFAPLESKPIQGRKLNIRAIIESFDPARQQDIPVGLIPDADHYQYGPNEFICHVDQIYFADAQDPQAKRSIFDKYADMQRQAYEAGQLAQQLVTAQNRIVEMQRRIDELTAPANPSTGSPYLHAALRSTGNL